MEILLENKNKIDENVLCEQNKAHYARIFDKMAKYARHQNAINENKYYHKHFDIIFNVDEQLAITDMLCTLRAHLYETMRQELNDELLTEGILGDVASKIKKTATKVGDKIKDVADKSVDVIKQKQEQILAKYKVAVSLLNKLIKSTITSVKDLISAFGKILFSLGENLSEALSKLGAFATTEKEDTEYSQDLSKVISAANINDKEKAFFAHVVEYVKIALDNKQTQKALTEGAGADLMDKIGNNKVFQFIFSVSKDRKKWSWIHTILVSLVGTFIISVILPMVLYTFGVAGSVISSTVLIVALAWNFKSLIRVIFNRWLSKEKEEKFWNWQTCLGVILSTVPVGLMQIPAIRDWFIDGLTAGLKFIGVDKLINNVEELLGKLVEKLGGEDFTKTTEVAEIGRYVEETIASMRNAGDVTTDLMISGSSADYINGLFASDAALSHYNAGDVNVLKSWLEHIADANYRSSLDMLNSMSGSLSSEAPITAVLDGNTFGHVSRETLTKTIESVAKQLNIECELINVTNDNLRETTSNIAGTAYALVFNANSTSENAAMVGDLLTKVADEMGLKATGAGYSTFGTIVSQLQDSLTVWHESVINTVTTHHLFDTMMNAFQPVFNPFFKKDKWNKYKIRVGSNASGYPAYKVSKVEHMSLDKVLSATKETSPALNMLIKHIQDVQRQHKSNIDAGISQVKEENENKVPKKNKGILTKYINKFNKNNDIAKREVMVIYGDVLDKETKKVKERPIVAIDMLTMYCADLDTWFPKYRKTIYPVLGLLARLDFIPVEKNDNDTKQFIWDMLNTFISSSVKTMVEFGTADCYVKKANDNEENKKYVPADNVNKEESYFDIGCLTPVQVCQVLNEEIEPYSLIDATNAKKVSVSTDKETGEIKKKSVKNDVKIIEKKRYRLERTEDGKRKYVEDKNGEYDYVDAKIVPYINKYLINEIAADDDLAELFLTDDKSKVAVEIINDRQLNLKQWLFRPAKTFKKEDALGIANSINEYLRGHNKEEKLELYNTVKKFIEIVWKSLAERVSKQVESRHKPKKSHRVF